MKYNLEDSSDNIVVISDIDAMYKKVVNEFGDEAVFINPYCIQCGAQIDVKIDNFTFYQAEKGKHFLYCEKCNSPYEPLK